MKFMKKLAALFSFLLPTLFLFTGCSPEMEELAVDILTGVVSEMEIETEVAEETLLETESELEEFSEIEEDFSIDESITDETFVVEDVIDESSELTIVESGTYTSKEEVAAYLYTYGHLPSNFITKKEARNFGWVSNEGNLWEVAPEMSIGGDYFGNYEGNLPEALGRDYYECDIDTNGSYRGAKRIVYSNDGLIYYTEDHYETFELLYGEE